MERAFRHSLQILGAAMRRLMARPEFIPVCLGTIAGIVAAYFLTSIAGLRGGPGTLIFLLYSLGLPATVVLALRNHHLARALGIAFGFCAISLLAARLAFDLISLPTDSQLRSMGTSYLGLLTFVMALVRNLGQRGNTPRGQAPDEQQR